MTTSKNIIVSFHIGRGGRFNNPGHKTFLGEMNYQQLIDMNSDHLYITNRDENGRFCTPFLANCNGNMVSDTIKGEVGELNFDNEYDSDYCKLIQDCTDAELQIIADSNLYKSSQLEDYLNESLILA